MVSALLYFGQKHAYKPREAQIERDRQTKAEKARRRTQKGTGERLRAAMTTFPQRCEPRSTQLLRLADHPLLPSGCVRSRNGHWTKRRRYDARFPWTESARIDVTLISTGPFSSGIVRRLFLFRRSLLPPPPSSQHPPPPPSVSARPVTVSTSTFRDRRTVPISEPFD